MIEPRGIKWAGRFEAGDGKGQAGHHNPYMVYVLVLWVPSLYHQCDGGGAGAGGAIVRLFLYSGWVSVQI